jgi:hypothetical protein
VGLIFLQHRHWISASTQVGWFVLHDFVFMFLKSSLLHVLGSLEPLGGSRFSFELIPWLVGAPHCLVPLTSVFPRSLHTVLLLGHRISTVEVVGDGEMWPSPLEDKGGEKHGGSGTGARPGASATVREPVGHELHRPTVATPCGSWVSFCSSL